jgi:type IV secretion system protein VirB4
MIKVLDAFHGQELGSVADTIPYMLVQEDGLVITKQGAVMASWTFMGPDMESASEDELDVLSERVKEAFDRLANVRGWSVFINLYRVPSTNYPTVGAFNSRIGLLIDQERRLAYNQEGAHYESRYVLTLAYREPPREAQGSYKKLRDFFLKGSGISEPAIDLDRLVARFNGGVNEVIPALSAYLNMARLGTHEVRDASGNHTYAVDDHLSFLYYCLTGTHAVIRATESGYLIDQHLATFAMRADDRPAINGATYVALVHINGLPQRSLPGLFRGLDGFAMPIRVQLRGILLDKSQALAEMRSYTRKWNAASQNILHAFLGGLAGEGDKNDNTSATAMKADSRDFHDRIETDQARALFFSFNAVLYGDTAEEATARANEVVRYLHDLNFPAAVMPVHSGSAYYGALPGELYANVERPVITTRNLAHMMPLTGIWPGLDIHPCKDYPKNSPPNFYGRTTGTAPFRFCTHAMDTSGHTVIIGPSGGGKSVFLCFLCAQFERYEGAQAIIIDSGRSLYTLAKAMELDGVAAHYQLGADSSTVGFSPFQHIAESQLERDYATGLIEQMIVLSDNRPVTPLERRLIQDAVLLLCRQEKKTLLSLMALIQDLPIKQIIHGYLASPVGELLDAASENVSDAPFLFFETEELTGLDKRFKLPIYTHIIHLAMRRAMTRPTLFVMDEAWKFFDDEYMSRILREFLKVARKRNVAVVLATQALQDIEANKQLGSAVMQECLTKVFTPNAGADHRELDMAAYRAAGLTAHEITRVSHLRRADEYYYTSPVGRRPFSLDLHGVARTFCAGTSGQDLAVVDALIAQYPTDWVARLLERNALPDWADSWIQLKEAPAA